MPLAPNIRELCASCLFFFWFLPATFLIVNTLALMKALREKMRDGNRQKNMSRFELCDVKMRFRP